MNEEDENTAITVNRSLAPERIINASTPIIILRLRSLTHNSYLICGQFAFVRLQAANLLPLKDEFLL